jgi:ketosteroid isomerase-like protein
MPPSSRANVRSCSSPNTCTFPISEIAGEALAVHVFGEVAVLTGVQVARMQLPEGKARSSRVMLSNVFCHEEEGWRMVLSHAFELVHDL